MKTTILLLGAILMIAASTRALAQTASTEEAGGDVTCAELTPIRGAPADLDCRELQADIATAATAPYTVVQRDRNVSSEDPIGLKADYFKRLKAEGKDGAARKGTK